MEKKPRWRDKLHGDLKALFRDAIVRAVREVLRAEGLRELEDR
jgi:hypothetical protein